MRRTFIVLGLVAALLVGPSASAQTTPHNWLPMTQNWQGRVDSGGSFTRFTNERFSIIEVWVAVTSVAAKVQLITCDRHQSNIGVTRHIQTNRAAGMGTATRNKHFCMALARSVPANTNGILPGNGTTVLTGRVEF